MGTQKSNVSRLEQWCANWAGISSVMPMPVFCYFHFVVRLFRTAKQGMDGVTPAVSNSSLPPGLPGRCLASDKESQTSSYPCGRRCTAEAGP